MNNLIRRPWGVFYRKNKITGQQTSLKSSDKLEAQRILQARNEAEVQPHFNLSLARVFERGRSQTGDADVAGGDGAYCGAQVGGDAGALGDGDQGSEF